MARILAPDANRFDGWNSVKGQRGDASIDRWNSANGPRGDASIEQVVRKVLQACGSALEPEFRRPAADNPNAYASVPRFDIGKAARDLKWLPLVALDAGISRLVAWRDAQPR